MYSTGFRGSKSKKWSFVTLVSILTVFGLAVIPVTSLTVYEFTIKDKEIDYGEKLEVSIIFVGDGALRIKNAAGDTITLLTLKKGGEYTYQIDSEGLLYPGDYFVEVLDEDGVEVANESFKVTSTYTIIVVTFGEEKKTKSYLYDILIVPTSLKAGNNSLDIFFSSNTYSKGGAEVYLEVPDGWWAEKVRLDEIDFKNHVQLPISIPTTAYGSYILTLHVDTTFGKFNRSFAVSVEGGQPETVPTPSPTPSPTPYQTPTPTATQTPPPAPIPSTPPPANETTVNKTQPAVNGKTPPQETPTQKTPSTPGFGAWPGVVALLFGFGVWRRKR